MKMNKVNLTSSDLTEDKLSELRRVLPDAFSEDKIDWDKLRAVLGEDIETSFEKFNFTWSGKTNAIKNVLIPSKATLKPNKDKSIKFYDSENVFIEGDNLETLKLLQKTYFEKVKMIYIDPPYNTGGDFVYKDNFNSPIKSYLEQTGQVDSSGNKLLTNKETSGRYHSDWLSMMYPRLKLAWNLLKDDGIIFVSIDDNEMHRLRIVLDEIFGEENFIACITIASNPRGRDYGGVARMHDFILIYSKSFESEVNSLPEPNKVFPFEDEVGGFEIRELRNRNIAFHIGNRPNLYYPFYLNPENRDKNGFLEISLDKQDGWIEVLPRESQGYKTVWRWGKPKASINLNTEIIGKEMDSGGFQIVEKYRKKTKMARTIWADKESNTEKGTLLVKEMFEGKKLFSFPKPLEMIMRIIEMGTEPNNSDIVLDFFAGSATTAHAVLQQNMRDKGNRRFIVIQLPEPLDKDTEAFKLGYRFISDISVERIKKAIKGFGANPVSLEDGFKFLKLSESNYVENKFELDPDIDESENAKLYRDYLSKAKQGSLFTKHNNLDVIYENIIKEGLSLNSKIVEKTVGKNAISFVSDDTKELVICLDNKIASETVSELTGDNFKGKTFICIDSALNDSDKANLALNVELKTI